MINYSNLVLVIFLVGFTFSVNAETLVSHDFDDGTLSGWEACTTQNPNYTIVENGRIKTFWTETGYNGTRMDKGAEACNFNFETFKEGWYGVTVNIGSDYPRNTEASICQMMGHGPCLSWIVLLQIINGDLALVHRLGCTSPTSATIYPDFPYQTDMDIVMHAIFSGENNGEFQIWVNGESVYLATNIDLGNGSFTNDILDNFVGFKMGQYNYDDGGYTNDETRTVYYDNVSWYNGSDGYSIVDPSGASNDPYGGAPRSVPGRIEVEEYDLGGEGIAYHDTTLGNSGVAFRDDDVDIAEYDEGYIVGWTSSGEWLEYTVNVIPGTYAMNLRVASPYDSRQIVVKLDGAILETIDIPNTSDWFSYQTVTVEDVSVAGGSNQILRIEFPNGNVNANWFQFILPVDGDLTFDKKVNLEDVAELSAGWQSGYTMDDLLGIANNWLSGIVTNISMFE